ncbi:hypothetical protein cyc_05663 [Cyclospora cayetanensis]|uniref:Uncharacterized protein n=1 Tax=Cyclospora cayetanensis TaxID=88456 RepID=A0A1D3D366_9EIME|nr:hypothetical protein cyc_05663 [Cyclospora cayetanensis]
MADAGVFSRRGQHVDDVWKSSLPRVRRTPSVPLLEQCLGDSLSSRGRSRSKLERHGDSALSSSRCSSRCSIVSDCTAGSAAKRWKETFALSAAGESISDMPSTDHPLEIAAASRSLLGGFEGKQRSAQLPAARRSPLKAVCNLPTAATESDESCMRVSSAPAAAAGSSCRRLRWCSKRADFMEASLAQKEASLRCTPVSSCSDSARSGAASLALGDVKTSAETTRLPEDFLRYQCTRWRSLPAAIQKAAEALQDDAGKSPVCAHVHGAQLRRYPLLERQFQSLCRRHSS